MFYRDRTGILAVEVQLGPTFRAGRPRRLFEAGFAAGVGVAGWDVSPDGERVLVVKRHAAASQTARDHVTFVLNWFEDLRRLAPFPK